MNKNILYFVISFIIITIQSSCVLSGFYNGRFTQKAHLLVDTVHTKVGWVQLQVDNFNPSNMDTWQNVNK